MTEVVLFHHVRGLTAGVSALGEAWRADGHTVHTPDLFAGHTFDSIADGSAYADEVGFATLLQRAGAGAAELGGEVVYAGISMGAAYAEYLSLTRPGARGVVMLESAVAPAMLADYGAPAWPAGLAFQIHGMEADPYFAGEGDLAVAREMVATLGNGELFVYPGAAHLFCDASLAEYDAAATGQLVARVSRFLDGVAGD